MEILSKLLGGQSRVKIMRLFLLNPNQNFDPKEVAQRSKVPLASARKELNALTKISFIRQKDFTRIEETKRGPRKKKLRGFTLNTSFRYINQLKALLVDPNFLKKEDIVSRFRGVGRVKLLVASGIFIQDEGSRVDLLVVGDKLKRNLIESSIKMLEAEIGKELVYAVFETQDFIYRLNMYDKLVRDIIDYPHECLIDSKEFSTLTLKKSQ